MLTRNLDVALSRDGIWVAFNPMTAMVFEVIGDKAFQLDPKTFCIDRDGLLAPDRWNEHVVRASWFLGPFSRHDKEAESLRRSIDAASGS